MHEPDAPCDPSPFLAFMQYAGHDESLDLDALLLHRVTAAEIVGVFLDSSVDDRNL